MVNLKKYDLRLIGLEKWNPNDLSNQPEEGRYQHIKYQGTQFQHRAVSIINRHTGEKIAVLDPFQTHWIIDTAKISSFADWYFNRAQAWTSDESQIHWELPAIEYENLMKKEELKNIINKNKCKNGSVMYIKNFLSSMYQNL